MSQTSNNSLLITPTSSFNCGLNHGTNEFAVIGDEFAITSSNSVPDWFVDIIGGIVNDNVQAIYNSLLTHNSNLLASLEQVEIAKNTYQQYINKIITDESAYVSALNTLNSNIAGNDASIRQLLTTYATSELAATTAAQLLTASLNGGTIGARIGSAESSMATQYGAMSQRLDQLDTAFYDTNSQVNSTALAVQKLTTYTGLGTFDGLPAVIANSNFYRTLNAYLDGTNYGTVGGSSTLLHDINTISTAKATAVEAKFAYGSTIHLGGKDYKAGFGLVQTGTVSGDGTTYNSEFWVDASKFKFTNSNNTGQVSPFTIDASGSTPKITFNGNVVIGNRATAVPGGLPKFLGNYTTPPTTTVSGDTYKNTSTGIVYVWDGSSWVTTKGDNGINGSRGTGFGVSTANSPSDSAFMSSTGFPYAIDGDQLLLTNSSGSRFYRRQYGIWGNNTTLLVDGNAIINGMALVKGKLLTGNGIESSIYTPGSSGWRISADGDAEFNSLTVRTKNIENNAVTTTYHAKGPEKFASNATVEFNMLHDGSVLIVGTCAQGAEGNGIYFGVDGTTIYKESPVGYSLCTMQHAMDLTAGQHSAFIQGGHDRIASRISVFIRYR